MNTKGINRVAILVKDLDRAVALYSELLNTTFYPFPGAELAGVRAVLSVDPMVEIASPIPGSNEPMARELAQWIKEHGEGLYAVVFSVDDGAQARAKAEELGIRVVHEAAMDPDDVKKSFQGGFSTFIEYFLNPEDTHGVQVVLGQF